MDERLEKALEFSNFMVTLDNQLRNLREKFYQDTIFYHNPYMNQMWSKIMTYKVGKLFKNETY